MKLTHIIAAAILTTGLAATFPGCQTEMAAVPTSATLVASGTGTTSYTAANDGKLYIWDKTWNKLVYSGDIKAGQNVKLDTLANKILVDGQVLAEQVQAGGGSEFEFRLQPLVADSTTTIERRTVIERDVHQ